MFIFPRLACVRILQRKGKPYFDVLLYQSPPRERKPVPFQKTFGLNKIQDIHLRKREMELKVVAINRVLKLLLINASISRFWILEIRL